MTWQLTSSYKRGNTAYKFVHIAQESSRVAHGSLDYTCLTEL